MAYQLRYYSNFSSSDGHNYAVKIYKDSEDIITSSELKLSSDAITVTYESDDIYQPLKQSGCTVNFLISNIISDVYTGKINDVAVEVLKDGTLFWYGYATPNIYSSEFESDLDLLSLECIDVISQLEYVKFQESESAINTFYNVISNALSKIDINRKIRYLYLHKVLSVEAQTNILQFLYIQERNFFDENKEPQTYKSVIEDIIRYLGLTMVQYGDGYYLLDYPSIQSNSNFLKYDLTTGLYEEISVVNPIRTIGEIGVFSANATISMGNIYNKIKIIANNNPINDILPGLFNDLVNQNADPSNHFSLDSYNLSEIYSLHVAYFNSSSWNVNGLWGLRATEPYVEINPTIFQEGNPYIGSFFQKMASYRKEDGIPSNLNWTDYLSQFCMSVGCDKSIWFTKKSQIFKGGYFIVDMEYMLSRSPYPLLKEYLYKDTKFIGKFKDTNFRTKLQIGNYYFNGKDWQTTECYFFVCHKNKLDEQVFNAPNNLTNQISYTDDLVDSGDGALITLPENLVLHGDLNFTLYSMEYLGGPMSDIDGHSDTTRVTVPYCHISDFKFIYTTKDVNIDIFNKDDFDPDVLYENIIDDGFVTELEDMEMKVNTYSSKAGSYSYVLSKANEIYDFVENIVKQGISNKMEHHNIEKYHSHYSSPKLIYQNSLNNSDIKPYSLIKSVSTNKVMAINNMIYNLSSGSCDITLTEL